IDAKLHPKRRGLSRVRIRQPVSEKAFKIPVRTDLDVHDVPVEPTKLRKRVRLRAHFSENFFELRAYFSPKCFVHQGRRANKIAQRETVDCCELVSYCHSIFLHEQL